MVMFLKHLRMCILVIVALTTTTLMAQGASRQEVLDVEITISLKDVSLKQALQEIEQVAKIKFVYSKSYLNLDDRVTIDVAGRKLGQLLEELLTPRSIRFAVHDSENFVVLTQAKTRSLIPDDVGSTPITTPTYATRISGKVTDASGSGMAGVNVVEKGTTNGTSTDATGLYSLEISDNAVLIFSFIGFKSVEEQTVGRSMIDIIMEEDQAVLDAVLVNAGYWKVNEREQTGSISRVTAEEIQRQPVGNPMAALIGRMPGVHMYQTSGMPGAPFEIQIRGRNSLRLDGNRPLYIVDGVPFPATSVSVNYSLLGSASPLNSINPADIESIEILKDADATAIYGTRGANGVVLITTKKGGPGKTKLDLNVYTGVGKVGHFMELLTSEQYLMMRREAHRNDGTPIDSWEYDLTEWDTTRYTDWQKVLIGGTSRITSAQLSISGGAENTQFQFGAGYYSEGTVFPGNFGDKKLSTHATLTHQSTNKKFNFSFQNSVVIDNNNLPRFDYTTTALSLPPVAPELYNEDGTLNWENGTWPSFTNPLSVNLLKYDINSQNLISNISLGYELLPGMRLKSSIGYNYLYSKDLNLAPIAANDPILGVTTGFSDNTRGLTKTWIAEPQIEYLKELSGGRLIVLVGSTFQQTTRSAESIRASGYTNDALLENLASAATLRTLNSSFLDYKYNAIFGRINYSYGGKYFINVTTRRDGSSRFGPSRRFANFGAIGGAWVFSEEFFKGSRVLNFGKLRGSFGITGNDQMSDYGYLDSYVASSQPYQGRSGLVPTRLANPEYSWEKTLKTEVALDLGFLDDRLGFNLAFYRNKSSNQLTGYNLPRITGFSSIQSNLPAVIRNTGIELLVRSENVANKTIHWETSFMLTIPRNKLVSYPGIETSPNANQWEVGNPLATSKRYHFTGVDPQTGFYTFEDLNGNGRVDSPGDLMANGFVGQKYFGSLINTLQYKGFDLSFMIQYVNQTGRVYHSASTAFGLPGNMTNQPVQVLDRWQKLGDDAEIQKFTMSFAGTSAHEYSGSSDNLVVDASFIRLRNVSVNYTLPEKITKNWKVNSAKVFLQGQNLMTFSNYVGMDPEPAIPNSLPPLRVLTGGLQISI
jgi:TonB-linked SusC/RagA family outer membrane protein